MICPSGYMLDFPYMSAEPARSSDERLFVVAVKREERKNAPSDWVEALCRIEGVAVREIQPRQIIVRASPAGIGRVRDRFGSLLYVEELIPHSIA